MLHPVDVGTQHIAAYTSSAGADVVDGLQLLARSLRDVRVLHLNATPYGGGVAEILRSKVPLLRDLGLQADWKLITGDDTLTVQLPPYTFVHRLTASSGARRSCPRS